MSNTPTVCTIPVSFSHTIVPECAEGAGAGAGLEAGARVTVFGALFEVVEVRKAERSVGIAADASAGASASVGASGGAGAVVGAVVGTSAEQARISAKSLTFKS